MDPTTATPAAPAAATPAAPAAAEPKKSSLLSNILGLVKPEEVVVKPTEATPPAAPTAESKPEPKPEVKPEPKPEDAAPTPPVETKKVPVKARTPAASAPSAEEVRRIAAEEAAKAAKPAPAAPAPAPAAPDDSDLTPEEKDELELAQLAEAKDPSRKGLTDKFRKFYQEQKRFLEGRLSAEGDGYNPDDDPEFKKFLAKSQPKFTSTERKVLREEKIKSEAAAQAAKAAEEKFAPELERLRMKTLELEHKPKIIERVDKYTGEMVTGMPEDVVEFFEKNGRDAKKTKEAFPQEFDIIVQSINGATTLAQEALSLRRGITKYNPKDDKHQFLDGLLDSQAKWLLGRPVEERTLDGKTFVHPYDYTPEMADKHWTFDDEDVLDMIKRVAQSEAKTRVKNHRESVKAANEAAARRTAAPVGASATPPAPAPAAEPSSRTPPAITPGVAQPAKKPSSPLSRVLNLV